MTHPARPELQPISPGSAAAGEMEIVREMEAAAGETVRFFKDLVRTRAADGRYVESTQVRVRHAPGRADGVVVAPIDEDGRILLVRQFRHATRMWMRELPRGGRERGETVEEAAARELREEIGCETISTMSIGRVAPDGAVLESIPHLVAARVRPAGAPKREATEAIDRVLKYRFTDLTTACIRGDVIDGYTLAAVLRLGPFFEGDRWRSG